MFFSKFLWPKPLYGEQPFVSCLETSLLVGPPEERNLYICWFSDNSIILCNNLSNSFPPVVLSKKPNANYFSCLLFWLFLRCFLERLGTLFCHHFEILEVSEALDDTVRTAKMRSTIWEWSQSLQGSRNNKKKKEILQKYFVERFGTLFCHQWGADWVSGAENFFVRIRKMWSTIWEWSQSLRSSKNKEKIGNTSKKHEKQKNFVFSKTMVKLIRKHLNLGPQKIKSGGTIKK